MLADSTLAELTSALQFRTDTLGLLRRAWLATFPYLTAPERKLHFVRPLGLVQMLLDGDDNGLFWALISDRKSEKPVFFSLVDAESPSPNAVDGTWLIDDIDFSKMGTGWWGNEFGWQGGLYAADAAGIPNLDAVVEYARLEPYVYSNRVSGNDFTHNNMSLGHHLQPNSDEWFGQLAWRPLKSLRAWMTYTRARHGENVYDAAGGLVKNVGGDVLQGHRNVDADVVTFLDGNLVSTNTVQLRATYEPITNLFVSGIFEHRTSEHASTSATTADDYGALRIWVEY